MFGRKSEIFLGFLLFSHDLIDHNPNAMITFLTCLTLLVAAYFVYGRVLERMCGIDPRRTMPSATRYDGVDYIPLPLWKTFTIQLLNIAGLGPFFGAVLGAAYGPVAFVWITAGSILIGGVHDFVAGVISVKSDGRSLPEIVGAYLGNGMRVFMRAFSVLLMVVVGAVFMSQPAKLLAARFASSPLDTTAFAASDPFSWLLLLFIGIILLYYVVATLLPVDKIIGRLYPLFGAAMLFTAFGVLGVLLFGNNYVIPELASFANMKAGAADFPVIPMLCATISCGAISGFHATQSPMMARCLRNERECRPVFFGAMLVEGVIALVWAAIAMSFWGGVEGLNDYISTTGGEAAVMIDTISTTVFGSGVAVFVVAGIVASAITSGDTAFRSARLIVSDFMNIGQSSLRNRVLVSLPLFAAGLAFVFLVPFRIAWHTMAWTNQVLAVITLWAVTCYLARRGKAYFATMLPAMFMTFVCTSFVFVAPHMLCLHNIAAAYAAGAAVTAVATAAVLIKIRHNGKTID